MTDFFNSETLHDRILLVDRRQFYVQSGLLSSWSEFFYGLFNSDFKEKNEEIVEIKGLKADDFKIFLHVLYGEYFEIEEKDLEPLVALAQRFLAPEVTAICKRRMELDFHKLDKYALLDISYSYDLEDIKNKTLDYFMDENNFARVEKIELVQLAFKHDLKMLEEKLRESLATSAKEASKYREIKLRESQAMENLIQDGEELTKLLFVLAVASVLSCIANLYKSKWF